MSTEKKTKTGSTRRKFIKELAIGSSAIAVASTMPGFAADTGQILQGISKETSDGKSRYGKCIVSLPIRKFGETVMFSAGADLLNGFPCNIIYAFGLKVGPLGLSRKPHVHEHDEVIYFIGSDPKSTELGAEVNFKIGPKGEEEDHIFSVPTAVVIPKGVWHCPMETLKCDQPFLCMAVSITNKYSFESSDKKKQEEK
jgi:hypothetical protein